MKFLALAALASLGAASPVCRDAPAEPCVLQGFNGVVPSDVTNNYLAIFPGIKDAEECRKKCYSAEYSSCKSFAVRYTGSGACRLWDYQVAPRALRPGETSTFFYYNTPEGTVGWVPENVAQHYFADTSKTKGTYAGCRGVCLSDARCKGFGYKNNGNCQLYDVSLAGKVKPKADSPYIQYQVDCTAAPYTIPS